jgi:hypothetical protein
VSRVSPISPLSNASTIYKTNRALDANESKVLDAASVRAQQSTEQIQVADDGEANPKLITKTPTVLYPVSFSMYKIVFNYISF